MKINRIEAAIVCALGLAFAGCATSSSNKAASGKSRATAVAVLAPAAGKNVAGRVTFREETEGIRVTADITGLTPGQHGFHIHEKGDCSAADFASAGGHFNPMAAKHGAPTDPDHHAGDFGNIEANPQGVARFERVVNWLSFKGTNSFVGKAVVVHDKPDDLKTQPSGNAGGRIACGVINQTSTP